MQLKKMQLKLFAEFTIFLKRVGGPLPPLLLPTYTSAGGQPRGGDIFVRLLAEVYHG